MREILFRGKTPDGKWIYGDLIKDPCEIHGEKYTEYIIRGYDKFDVDGNEFFELVTPKTVGQYTGLKDKNGEMIFEGDVVCGINGSFNGCPCEWGPFPVEYDESEAKFIVPLWGTYENNDKTHWFEVIGNIHDTGIDNNSGF